MNVAKTIVPPIKSQGIKTKLVPWINDIILRSGLDLCKTNSHTHVFDTKAPYILYIFFSPNV